MNVEAPYKPPEAEPNVFEEFALKSFDQKCTFYDRLHVTQK